MTEQGLNMLQRTIKLLNNGDVLVYESSYLIDVIIDDSKLSKLLHFPRDIIKLIEIDGQRRLVDHSLHAGHPEAVVVRVVKACVHHPVFAKTENLLIHQRADLPVSNGADEAFTLQINCLQNTSSFIVGKADPC